MYRQSLLALCIVCVASLTGGCALFADQIDKAGTAGGKLVTFYCENTTADVREAIRAEVNAKAAPHSVAVTCASAPTVQ